MFKANHDRVMTLRGCQSATMFAFATLLVDKFFRNVYDRACSGGRFYLGASESIPGNWIQWSRIYPHNRSLSNRYGFQYGKYPCGPIPGTSSTSKRTDDSGKRVRRWRDDCVGCPELVLPELVLVPAGMYTMGSPRYEKGRYISEGPQRQITIEKPFAVGVHEITRGEFSDFVSDAQHSLGDSCKTYEDGEWKKRFERNWLNPGFPQTDTHPVVCVNWEDAQAYVQWLSKKTEKDYRLLSEAEWEYVVRGKTETSRYWGDESANACVYENVADYTAKKKCSEWTIHDCQDGVMHTSEVGRYQPNDFGLHDMLGNVIEWVEDCQHRSYEDAPKDGKAWTESEGGKCIFRMLRGGSWSTKPRIVRSAVRHRYPRGERLSEVGFRIARAVERGLGP